VDYALVLSGEIWALMDEGETLLRAGDTLVQRGTNHAWSNRGDQPCLVAFILVSATGLGAKRAGKPGAKPVTRAVARAGRGSPSRRPSRKTTARPRRKPRPR
jgi:hypothetical protein